MCLIIIRTTQILIFSILCLQLVGQTKWAFNSEVRPLKTEKDYNNAISRIEQLWGAKKDTIEGDELDLLATVVESYEMKHYPITTPDPVDAIKFRMEQMGMTKADMLKY